MTRERVLFRSLLTSLTIWNVWWWPHVVRGNRHTTWYVGPFVLCIEQMKGKK